MDQKTYAPDAPPPYPGPPAQGMSPPPGFNPAPHGDPYPPPQAPGYPGYPAAYTQQPQPVNVTPVVTGRGGVRVVRVTGTHLGTNPARLTCPNCGADVVTRTETQAGLLTYLICGMCILFGCWAGCCLIPFCIPECQDVEHSCPNCKVFLGSNRCL